MENLFAFLVDNENSNIIAIAAILIGWVIYRLNLWVQRKAILYSVAEELKLHGSWVNSEYSNGDIDPSWHQKGYVVFKLSTVAIDNAIAQGSGLFLNIEVIPHLTGYRQRVIQFNQLIDLSLTYQSNVDLWKKTTNVYVEKRMFELICQIHWYGISNRNKPFAYTYFNKVNTELNKELSSHIIPLIWLLFNINFFPIKKLSKRLSNWL